ncbi:I78 family peptidase inhibitor [Aquicoccus sp. G2-2]|uniref:I78 family peptidase inhibitor n=1 Tax=Aquicoccus sp. G2-2 TaxID=3092120 RepID=UPI002AE06F7E|nr:I78 family peptidase inhibitor [Aquicoccus sp. G2-2]MEA1114659.1 I78 family peptidase inhibitor [Aquicoccus sp. G2-2]
MPNISPIALVGAVALSACQPGHPTPAPDTCDSARYRPFIGAQASAVDFSAQKVLRIIAPGQPVTMDFRAERLNVETDAAGRIVKLSCG